MLRLATVEDISEIYMMLMVMHSGTVDGTSPVDSEKLTAAINTTLHKGIVIVFEVDGKIVQLSEAGWLEDLSEWNEEVAKKIAADVEQCELTDESWDIINLTREMFEENGQVAEPRKFLKEMKNRFGKDRSSNKYIFTLFPKGGLIKSANKVAGLPRPKGCS